MGGLKRQPERKSGEDLAQAAVPPAEAPRSDPSPSTPAGDSNTLQFTLHMSEQLVHHLVDGLEGVDVRMICHEGGAIELLFKTSRPERMHRTWLKHVLARAHRAERN